MDARRSIASIAGVAFTLAFPFLDWSRLIGHAHWPGILLKVVSAALLAVIGFLINKRTAGFYQIRGFGWRDVAIAVAGLELHFAAILATADVLAHFEVTGTQSPAAGWGAGPLWFALLAALSAAVSEEFMFRGFVIEELGELIHSRPIAAALSLVAFTLAHFRNFGWTLELIYPALGGLLFTILYLWRRSLPLCMLVHATIDCIVAVLKYN